jgi:hypothetical protein
MSDTSTIIKSEKVKYLVNGMILKLILILITIFALIFYKLIVPLNILRPNYFNKNY